MASVYDPNGATAKATKAALTVGTTGTSKTGQSTVDATRDAYIAASKQMPSTVAPTSSGVGVGVGATNLGAASPYAKASPYAQSVQPAASSGGTTPVASAPAAQPSAPQSGAAPNGGKYIDGLYYSAADLAHFTDPARFNQLKTYKLAGDNSGAEAMRALFGYSGGPDGSQYNSLGLKPGFDPIMGAGYSPAQYEKMQYLDAYINNIWDAGLKKALSANTSAYNQNMIDAQTLAAKIPGLYETSRNQTAGSAAVNAQNFNEYAAAMGLNSGAGGQAQLAMNNALLGELGSLNRQESQAMQDVDFEMQRIKRAYEDAAREIAANNEYGRAGDLFQDASTVRGTNHNLQVNQSDENYRSWAANYGVGREFVDDSRYADTRRFERDMLAYEILSRTGGDIPPELLQSLLDDPAMAQTVLGYLEAAKAPVYGGTGGSGGTGYKNPSSVSDEARAAKEWLLSWAVSEAAENSNTPAGFDELFEASQRVIEALTPEELIAYKNSLY